MKKINKLALTLGTAASIGLPISAVVSCGSDSADAEPKTPTNTPDTTKTPGSNGAPIAKQSINISQIDIDNLFTKQNDSNGIADFFFHPTTINGVSYELQGTTPLMGASNGATYTVVATPDASHSITSSVGTAGANGTYNFTYTAAVSSHQTVAKTNITLSQSDIDFMFTSKNDINGTADFTFIPSNVPGITFTLKSNSPLTGLSNSSPVIVVATPDSTHSITSSVGSAKPNGVFEFTYMTDVKSQAPVPKTPIIITQNLINSYFTKTNDSNGIADFRFEVPQMLGLQASLKGNPSLSGLANGVRITVVLTPTLNNMISTSVGTAAGNGTYEFTYTTDVKSVFTTPVSISQSDINGMFTKSNDDRGVADFAFVPATTTGITYSLKSNTKLKGQANGTTFTVVATPDASHSITTTVGKADTSGAYEFTYTASVVSPAPTPGGTTLANVNTATGHLGSFGAGFASHDMDDRGDWTSVVIKPGVVLRSPKGAPGAPQQGRTFETKFFKYFVADDLAFAGEKVNDNVIKDLIVEFEKNTQIGPAAHLFYNFDDKKMEYIDKFQIDFFTSTSSYSFGSISYVELYFDKWTPTMVAKPSVIDLVHAKTPLLMHEYGHHETILDARLANDRMGQANSAPGISTETQAHSSVVDIFKEFKELLADPKVYSDSALASKILQFMDGTGPSQYKIYDEVMAVYKMPKADQATELAKLKAKGAAYVEVINKLSSNFHTPFGYAPSVAPGDPSGATAVIATGAGPSNTGIENYIFGAAELLTRLQQAFENNYTTAELSTTATSDGTKPAYGTANTFSDIYSEILSYYFYFGDHPLSTTQKADEIGGIYADSIYGFNKGTALLADNVSYPGISSRLFGEYNNVDSSHHVDNVSVQIKVENGDEIPSWIEGLIPSSDVTKVYNVQQTSIDSIYNAVFPYAGGFPPVAQFFAPNKNVIINEFIKLYFESNYVKTTSPATPTGFVNAELNTNAKLAAFFKSLKLTNTTVSLFADHVDLADETSYVAAEKWTNPNSKSNYNQLINTLKTALFGYLAQQMASLDASSIVTATYSGKTDFTKELVIPKSFINTKSGQFLFNTDRSNTTYEAVINSEITYVDVNKDSPGFSTLPKEMQDILTWLESRYTSVHDQVGQILNDPSKKWELQMLFKDGNTVVNTEDIYYIPAF